MTTRSDSVEQASTSMDVEQSISIDIDIQSESSLSSDEFPDSEPISQYIENKTSCGCMQLGNFESIDDLIKNMMLMKTDMQNLTCFINTLNLIYNQLIHYESGDLTWRRIYFVDKFYRLRHEILCRLTIESLGMSYSKSDIPFSSFGVDSIRTPDYILQDGKLITVIEITASSNEEKSFQNKGLEEAGFESKYQREIDILRRLGNQVNYYVLHYNMRDSDDSNAYRKIIELKETCGLNVDDFKFQSLKYCCKELSTFTNNTAIYLSPASALLFVETIDITPDFDNINMIFDENSEKLLEEEYIEYNVSLPVYQKINNLWFRLNDIKNRTFKGQAKDRIVPVIDMSTNKINFNIAYGKDGIDQPGLDKIILENDKKSFLELLMIKSANKLFKAIESTTGVKFVKKRRIKFTESTKSRLIQINESHSPTIVSNCSLFDNNLLQKYLIKEKQCKGEGMNGLKYYKRSFESDYIEMITKMDEDLSNDSISESFKFTEDYTKMLYSCKTSEINLNNLKSEMFDLLIQNNNFDVSVPTKIQKMKMTFILPLANVYSSDRCKIEYKNISFLNKIVEQDIGDFTRHVVSKSIEPNYSFYNSSPPPSQDLNNDYKIRFENSSEITKIVKSSMRLNNNIFKVENLGELEKERFKKLTNGNKLISKIINRKEKEQKIKKNIEFVRVNLSKNNELSRKFKEETKHFKDRSKLSSYEGVGLKHNIEGMYESLNLSFDQIREEFCNNNGPNDDFLIDERVYEDCKILQQLKIKTMDDYKNIINSVRDSSLGHSSALVSRLCHSLCFYSQMAFNKNYIRLDNLGYTNVLLIVRGGSKIFKSKSSKFYRLIFPVSENVKSHYIDDSFGKSSSKSFLYNNRIYIVTPWALMHESVLLDSISFYPRVCSFCVLNSDPNSTFYNQISRYFLNVILAFHNRRGTEELLANFRYILLSTMGDYSSYDKMLLEFMNFNYDKLQAFIRLSLVRNYKDYVDSMRLMQVNENINHLSIAKSGLKNLITGFEIEDVEDLALMIYSTFLMTKAPYQRHAERAMNLKGIIKIHDLFNKEVGLDLSPKKQLESITVKMWDNNGGLKSYKDYSSELMSNDFKIDPYYCTQLGIYADSYFNQFVGRDDLLLEWIKILNKNWDSMATTTGLRGENKNNFWGQKGYFVIYDKILNDENYKQNILSLLNQGGITDDEKRKTLRKLNQSYYSKINEKPDNLIFHAVDKRQWRGGREIYVMDLKTKRMQQPIEKFMGFLCKKTDNELISIPADKRAQVIHHSLFEKDIPNKDLKTWFLTFDCSKWAPKSMFIKFALMIAPMSCIPYSFKVHFFNYLSRLYDKRLYFNNPEVKVLKNSINWSKDEDNWLISDKDKDGFYMVQPYSWVMGIFNYTSSLMHAFNQKYCSFILRETTMHSFNEDCQLSMSAHSDDSGGRITLSNEPMLVRALFIYEINLKSCNHLLSRKKCVVSRIYFEILSIIYMFSQLLALLPKFLGGLRFTPTDKGPAHDMLQTYSKCNELIVMGADFSTAYIYSKFYSAEIWRFYYKGQPKESDYKRPPQFLGMPDSHPLMVLLNGSDSDIIRIIMTSGYDNLILVHKLFNYFNMLGEGDGMIRPLKFSVQVRGVRKNFTESIEILNEIEQTWSITNVNFKNTFMDSLTFIKKLSEPGFVGSLVNETEIRRLSRAYYFRSGESVITKYGNKKLSFITDLIDELNLLSSKDSELFNLFFGKETMIEFKDEIRVDNPINQVFINYHNDLYNGMFRLYKYLDKLEFKESKLRPVIRTLKPTHVQILKFNRGFNLKFDPSQLISIIYEPNMKWALPNPNNLIEAQQQFFALIEHLGLSKDNLDPSASLKLVRAHDNKSEKEIYLYSSVPSHIRSVRNYSTIMSFLATNAFKNYEIHGMTTNLRSGLVSAPVHETDIDTEAYTISTMLDVLCSVGKSIDLNKLTINPIDFIVFKGGDISDLINNLNQRIFKDTNYYFYKHYLDYINLKYVFNVGEVSGRILDDSAYYTYLKEQKYNGVWYGKGTLFLSYRSSWLIIELLNNKTISSTGNFNGKMEKNFSSYLTDCLKDNNIDPSFNESIIIKPNNRSQLFLGYDLSGDLAVENSLNTRNGIEFFYKTNKPGILTKLEFTKIEYIKENLFLLKSEEGLNIKINTLKIERGEVSPLIKTIIDPKSIERYIIENSYDDFADFIDQAIMPDYGAEYYITLEEFKTGFQGSELYKLFTETQVYSPELLPEKFQTSSIPAARGSLLRMMLESQSRTGKEILRMPNRLNPSIMALRNEYPESFSVILNEKMKESFNDIYSDSEQLMIYNEFTKAALIEDSVKLKNSMIKLMSYWGYSSLLNVVEVFTFSRNINNHTIFNVDELSKINSQVYNDCFKKLIHLTRGSILKVYNKAHDEQKPIKNLFDDFDIDKLFTEYTSEIVYNIYNYGHSFQSISIGHLKLNNLLIALFADPKFNKTIIEDLSEVYPLNTLDFEPSRMDEILGTYNTLRYLYIKNNSSNNQYKLDFRKKYEHLPHSLLSPLSTFKDLPFVRYKPSRLKYHYFLDENLLSQLKRESVTFYVSNTRYLVRQELIDLKGENIMLSKFFTYENVLTQDFIESENFSEISYEFETGDPDMDTVNEYIEESGDIYEPTEIRKRGKTWVVPVKWLIAPYIEGQTRFINQLNNLAENVVILSNCLIHNFNLVRNNRVYIVNYGNINGDLNDMFVHVMSVSGLKGAFWDKYIGGKRIENYSKIVEAAKTDIIRSNQGSIKFSEQGKTFEQMIKENEDSKLKGKVVDEEDNILVGDIDIGISKSNKSNDEDAELEKMKQLNNMSNDIKSLIKDCVSQGILSEDKAEKICFKYLNTLKSKLGLKHETLMASLFTEVELNNIVKEIINNELTKQITESESMKMMQAPEALGSAFSHSKPDTKAYRDPRHKCELDSIHPDLAARIASGTLRISPETAKVMKNHYNTWRLATEHTRHNNVCKKFFLNIFLSAINDAAEVKRTKQDIMWQEIINNMATIIGEEPEDQNKGLYFRMSPTQNLRMKYRTIGN